MQTSWKDRIQNLLLPLEPPMPERVLAQEAVSRLRMLPLEARVVIKISAAYDLPYPFRTSSAFIAQTVAEILAARPDVKIVLTEGGVGKLGMAALAETSGLKSIVGAEFVDAETTEAVYMPNPNPTPHAAEGFWLPERWANADMRVLLTTCKLRSHHFQRWFSGGTRNLIGLLPRSCYQLSTSKRAMRSVLHQRGMDAMVADLYATAGKGALTILDARLLARQDEHIPLRFTKRVNQVLIADDPYLADLEMVKRLRLPFLPPYLWLIESGAK